MWTLDDLAIFGFSEDNINKLKARAGESNSNKLFETIFDVMTNNAYLGLWAPEIMSVIDECECTSWFFNKTSFELYVQSKYTLLNKEEEFHFSENEFNDLLSYISYMGGKSIEEKSIFLDSILKALKGMEIDGVEIKLYKPDILYGIKNLLSYLLDKECKYQEDEHKKNIIWQEAFVSLLVARRSILNRWLKEETFDNRLKKADLEFKTFYFHRIDLDLGREWNIQDVDDAVNLLINAVERYRTEMAIELPKPISRLNPSCVFNYIILKNNRSKFSDKINTFINNENITAENFFKDQKIFFLWNDQELLDSKTLRCLCKMVKNEKKFRDLDSNNPQINLNKHRAELLRFRWEERGGKGTGRSIREQLQEALEKNPNP